MNFNLKKLLAKLFRRRPKTALGIDIGSSAVKVVQLSRKRGRLVLDTYGASALGPYAGVEIGKAVSLSAEKLTEALSDIMREAKISARFGGLSVPFNSSLLSVIDLPAAAGRNLKNIVPIEAKKYVPVPINEVSLDWSIIPANDPLPEPAAAKKSLDGQKKPLPEKIKVLIVAIHNDVLARFQQIAEAISLDISFLEVEIFSVLRSVLEPGQPGPILVMDIGAAATKLYLVEHGNVLGSHSIGRGSQDITAIIARSLGLSVQEAEILKRTEGLGSGTDESLRSAVFFTLDYIFNETNKIIGNYRKERGRDIKKVILVGGGAALKGFTAAAAANLQTEVEAGNPFLRVETPAAIEELLQTTGPEFAVAAGLALRGLLGE